MLSDENSRPQSLRACVQNMLAQRAKLPFESLCHPVLGPYKNICDEAPLQAKAAYPPPSSGLPGGASFTSDLHLSNMTTGSVQNTALTGERCKGATAGECRDAKGTCRMGLSRGLSVPWRDLTFTFRHLGVLHAQASITDV
jgi:hypothetical protein